MAGRSAADLARVNRKTAPFSFMGCVRLSPGQLEDSLPVEGLVEVDESYFCGVRKGNADGALPASSSAAARSTP